MRILLHAPIQVRILEMVLRKEFNPDMRPHGRAEPELDVNCEDFIDLAAVSRQVPGKTPSEVKLHLGKE